MNILKGLNPAQAEVVKNGDGPILVLAGAGSGKTKTLTHRIAFLISNGVPSESILAVTFTNKAAKEMRSRLGKMLGKDPNDRFFMPWMGTFHGICVKILRIYGHHIGIDKNFTIYDEDDRQSLIKKILKELNIDNKQIKPKSVSHIISSSKNELKTAEDFAETAAWGFEQKVAEIFARYEQERKKANALDFDDLLSETVRLLKDSSEARISLRKQFEHILIDEYQDTNAAQYRIVKMLVNDKMNICAVGDDWQSIYSWRGADFRNILNFENDFKGTKVVKLEQNYRSTENILNSAHNVITKNKTRTDKKLFTELGAGESVKLNVSENEQEEAARIAAKISSEKNLGIRSFADFAILYRTNSQSRAIEEVLRHSMIDYKIFGGPRFYDRKAIKDLLAYLRVIHNPNDRVAFERIVNVPARGLGKVSLDKFATWQAENQLDIISSLLRIDELSTMSARARNSFKKLGEIFRECQILDENAKNPSEILERIIDRTDYIMFEKLTEEEQRNKEENIGELISDTKMYADLAGFLENAALMSSSDSESNEQVSLMTFHSAKGLEYPVVFLSGMEEGLFPHSRITDGDKNDLEEERRLCYVGMTRAKEELILSYARSRSVFGVKNYTSPSRFIEEAGIQNYSKYDLPDRNKSKKINTSWGDWQSKINNFTQESYDEFDGFDQEYTGDFDESYDSVGLKIDDKVRSPVFGVGRVISIDGYNVEIEFSSGKVRKLNAEYAHLEKA